MPEWDDEKVLMLIENYKARPIIWDPKNKDYSKKPLKEDAWTEIGIAVGTTGDVCKKKMIIILASWRREKAKEKKSGGQEKNSLNPKPVIFLDEIWIFSKRNVERSWQDDDIKSVRKPEGYEEAACKDKWKNLRSAYARYLRQKPTNGSSAQVKKKYYLADYLAFLTPFTKSKQQESSIPSPTNINEETSNSTHEEAREAELPESEVQDENNENERAVEDAAAELLVVDSSLTRNKVSSRKRKEVDPLEKCAVEYFTSKNRSQPETREDADLLFLKSLLPDLRQMTNAQNHGFKLNELCRLLMPSARKNANPNARKYKNYSEDGMAAAIEAVQNGRMSKNRAAVCYGINRTTLINHIKGTKCKKVGRPTVLNHQEEQLMVHALLKLADWGYGFDRQQLRRCVQDFLRKLDRPNPFRDGLPGVDWCIAFEKRWKQEISRRVAQNLPKNRALAGTHDVMLDFHNKIKELTEKYDLTNKPQNIFNCDETGFQTDAGTQKVLCKRGTRNPTKLVGSVSKGMYTVLMCCNAVGEFLPMFINPDMPELFMC
ncbi:madf domain transcription factor [Holotrichia oblita]|uniref:Madf domain transcription factor n=1 Tax=Holotrichia oblita TaxID=644536 RepID=A0ACB9SPX5_HOLOL|nr:madf domain transcription factor [Holotrichia oblita]